MENKEIVKKNNTPVMVIAFALVLILAGIGLIVTGNNKSLLGDKKKETDKPSSESESKSNTPVELNDDKAYDLLEQERKDKYAEEAWKLGRVILLARGDNNTFLILFDKEYDTNTETLQTIIKYENGAWVIDLNGWPEGSRPLDDYNFKYYNETPVEEPTEEPPVEEPKDEPIEEPTVEEPKEPTEEPKADEPITPDEQPVGSSDGGEQTENPTE